MARRRSYTTRATGLRLAALALAAAVVGAFPAAAAAKPKNVKVMTRNVYLGADLGHGTRAATLQELVNAAGLILSEVDQNDFRARSRGLAREIRGRRPHLVGLQEVALWRTQPCTESPIPPSATNLRYDFLKILLKRLNGAKKRYRAVVTQREFDFEVYVNEDGDESTAAPGCPLGSEFNGRLTMRDVILARRGVKTKRRRGGGFATLLRLQPGGVPVDVTRGWTSVNAKVGRSRKFRFVNTHFEAFDNQASNATNTGDSVGNGEVREAQAKELVGPGGPARSRLPVILLGDLNSDVETEVRPGDALAYQAVLDAGFVERGATRPFSCCLNSSRLSTSGGGAITDFDHNVDHVMTDTPNRVRLRRSAVIGRSPFRGFWPSDHAGIFSVLRVR